MNKWKLVLIYNETSGKSQADISDVAKEIKRVCGPRVYLQVTLPGNLDIRAHHRKQRNENTKLSDQG